MTDVAPGAPSEDPRDALIREQAQLIAVQAGQIAALEAAVRAGSRNSGSSSMPPSSDDLPALAEALPHPKHNSRHARVAAE